MRSSFKKIYYLLSILILFCLLFLTACHKTPEKRAVVKKIDNLAEFAKADLLKSGQTIEVTLPQEWKVNVEKKGQQPSDGTVTIHADLNLSDTHISVGNLPIIEVENKEFSQEELQHLVKYFSKGRQIIEKTTSLADYEYMLSRLEEKKDTYTTGRYQEIRAGLERCIVKLSEERTSSSSSPSSIPIEFRTSFSDPSMFAVFLGAEPADSDSASRFSCSFEGATNETIRAVAFDSQKGKTSNFSYRKGEFLSLRQLEQEKEYGNRGAAEQNPQLNKLLDEKINQLNQATFSQENEQAANQLLNDLGLDGYIITDTFPEYTFDQISGMAFLDANGTYWENAKIGQGFVFSRSMNGLPSRTEFDDKTEMGEKQYTPPFGVETLEIEVCNGEIRSFTWNNMSQSVKTVAENTKLMDFQTVSDTVVKKLTYYIATLGAAHDLTDTEYHFEIQGIELGYTYIPAYNKPEHTWLVPAWFIKIQDTIVTQGNSVTRLPQYTTVNALDGSIIVPDTAVLITQTQ